MPLVIAGAMAGCGARIEAVGPSSSPSPSTPTAADGAISDGEPVAAGDAGAEHAGVDDVAAGPEAPGGQPGPDPSEAIYDDRTIATYALTVDAESWDAICNDGLVLGDQWHRADLTWTSGGETDLVSGVGVKRSGVGSRPLLTPKPALRISFNEFEFANAAGPNGPGRKWRGVNRIKLDSMVGNTDKAMMRDRLAYGMFRAAGAIAPRSAYARLYVNGSFKGLYEVEEPVRQDMLRYNWGEESGNLYGIDGAGWGQELDIFMTNQYLWRGADPAAYLPRVWSEAINFPDGDHRDLVALLDDINNYPANEIRARLQQHIDLDGFLRHMAVTTVISDIDDVSHWADWARTGVTNNHFWYHRADTDRLEIIKWDPNASQGEYELGDGLARAGAPLGYCFDRIKMTAWIKNDPTAWAIYRAKVRKLIDGPATLVPAQIDAIYPLIKPHVYEDTLKGQSIDQGKTVPSFSNADFEMAVLDLKGYWTERIAYLKAALGP